MNAKRALVEITLEQLLHSRDERQTLEKRLIEEHKGLTLLVLTVVMPGRIKRNDNSLIAARAGVKALHEVFNGHIQYELERDLPTGYELFMLVNIPVEDAKRASCNIEDTHPLGRLFDIDVFTEDVLPVSRTALQLPTRRCLICEADARVCMRIRKHTYKELEERINQLIQTYVRGI